MTRKKDNGTRGARSGRGVTSARYEFRAWGDWDVASRQLSRMADSEAAERIDDCYLLVGDPACNAKIRRRRLKVKRLVEVRSGFQRWSSRWYRHSTGSPSPFDQVMVELGGRPADRRDRGKAPTTSRQLRSIRSIDGIEPVLVTKHRNRYRVDAIRAESCVVEIPGYKGYLTSVAIEGPDLSDLVELRSALGLTRVPNLPFHIAVGQQQLGRC
jgi:hypothetical protein